MVAQLHQPLAGLAIDELAHAAIGRAVQFAGRAVDAWLTHLDVERGVSPNTLAAYRRDLARWTAHLDALGVTRPQDVTEDHVTEFLARHAAQNRTAPARLS